MLTNARAQQLREAIATLHAKGITPGTNRLYELVGGRRAALCEDVRALRAQEPGLFTPILTSKPVHTPPAPSPVARKQKPTREAPRLAAPPAQDGPVQKVEPPQPRLQLVPRRTPPAKILANFSTLSLGGIELDCTVVEDANGKPARVLSGRKFHEALGYGNRHWESKKIGQSETVAAQDDTTHAIGQSETVAAQDDTNHTTYIPPFVSLKTLAPFLTDALLKYAEPIYFRTSTGLRAYAYRAELLPAVCTVYLRAERAGALFPQQLHIAERCFHLQNAFAQVGIIALVDEVTGFQEHREKDELQQQLQYYLGEQAAPWILTFTEEFYQEAFKLHGLEYRPGSQKRPPIIGKFTADYVWSQVLPPPIYAEMKARNPRVTRLTRTDRTYSTRKDLHHQWLTGDGRQHLYTHLRLVMHLMRAATTLTQFRSMFQSGQPRSQLAWSFFDEPYQVVQSATHAPQEATMPWEGAPA